MNRVKSIVLNEKAESMGLTGKGITVAIVDSGISEHKDLMDRVLFFKDYINGRNSLYDDNGHGTHVAGIVGGNGYQSEGKIKGMAPKCSFVVLKVLDELGNGKTEYALEALEWIQEHHVEYQIRLLNFSLGFVSDSSAREQQLIMEKLNQLWELGVMVVTVAGNKGPKEGSVAVPGISRRVLTVGSVEENGREALQAETKYSGRGPTLCCIVKPEVLAPGSNIISCDAFSGGYIRKTGTSMSAPIVTGALALGMEYLPRLLPKDWKLRLYYRSKKGASNSQSWGLLQVDKLLGL